MRCERCENVIDYYRNLCAKCEQREEVKAIQRRIKDKKGQTPGPWIVRKDERILWAQINKMASDAIAKAEGGKA